MRHVSDKLGRWTPSNRRGYLSTNPSPSLYILPHPPFSFTPSLPSALSSPPPPPPPPSSSLPVEASSPELANPKASPILPDTEPEEERKERVVRTLYEALNARDVDTVHRLLAQDIEWWFHGPPSRQHMMRLLTGLDERFVFTPSSIAAFECFVVVEGAAGRGSVFWVHVWTMGADGIITQVREYLNTSLTVTKLDPAPPPPSSASSSTSAARSSQSCVQLWQSKLSSAQAGKSVPALLLAI